jgi:hypothetical protein
MTVTRAYDWSYAQAEARRLAGLKSSGD